MSTEVAACLVASRPVSVPTKTGRISGWRLLVPALAGAGVLYLAHFPVAWGWLGWVALVPLLILVRVEASRPRLLLAAWLGGLAFYWPAIQWMRVADDRMYITWALLATYCSLYMPLAIGLIRYLDRRTALPLIVSVPVVWTALDYLRSFLFTGFAWYYLGHTQHDFVPIIQIADLTGAYGVTFVVAMVNAWLFELLWSRSTLRAFFGGGPARCCCLGVQSLAVVLLLGGTLAYGQYRLAQNDFADGPRVALVQSSLDQRLRNEGSLGGNAAKTMFLHCGELTGKALRQQPRPDLVVWPETSFGYMWSEVSPRLPADQVPEEWARWARETQELAALVAKTWRANLLLGVSKEELGGDAIARRFNTALLLLPDATAAGQFHKMHRVPFGEYVPLRGWLPFMDAIAPYDYDYSITPGDTFTRFTLGSHRFGVIICYEDTDPVLPRQYVASDPVDFLVNISNDGWFDGTAEHDEHLAICRFRAVECRRTVVRAVNMGVSAIIDGNGQIRVPDTYLNDRTPPRNDEGQFLPVSRWHEYKKTPGVLIATVPIDHRQSLYARWGDWLPILCGLVLMVGILAGQYNTGAAPQVATPQ